MLLNSVPQVCSAMLPQIVASDCCPRTLKGPNRINAFAKKRCTSSEEGRHKYCRDRVVCNSVSSAESLLCETETMALLNQYTSHLHAHPDTVGFLNLPSFFVEQINSRYLQMQKGIWRKKLFTKLWENAKNTHAFLNLDEVFPLPSSSCSLYNYWAKPQLPKTSRKQ